MNHIPHIQACLQRWRRAYKSWLILTLAVAAIATLLCATLLFAIADLTLQVPGPLRWLSWLLLVGSLAALAVIGGRLAWRRMGDEQMCRRAERLLPGARNRLINAMQFSRSGDASRQRVAEHLLAEAPLPLDTVSGWQLFPRRRLKLALLVTLLAAIGSGLVAWWNPAGYRVAVQRLLSPMAAIAPYTHTRIVAVSPGDLTVARGEQPELSVYLEGELPSRVTALLTTDAGDTKRLLLEPVQGHPGLFVVRTPPLFEPIAYRLEAGDATSSRFRIAIQSPPSLISWHLRAEPPAYTGLAPIELDADAAAPTVPAHSRLTLSLRASQPLAKASLKQGSQLLAEATGQETPQLTLTATLTGQEPLQLRLLSSAGLDAQAPLPLAIAPDLPPSVRFVADSHQITAEPTATIALPYAAEDDYGIAQIALAQVGRDGADTPLQTRQIDAARQQQVDGRFTVDLAALGAKAGSRLRFRLLARDAGPQAEARQGRSAILDIVIPLPAEQRREDEARRQRTDRTISQLIQLQRTNLQATRAHELRRAEGHPMDADAVNDLLAKQVAIRALAEQILHEPAVLGDLVTPIRGLIDDEMRLAVEALARLTRAGEAEWQPPLAEAVDLQGKILATLTGLPEALAHEQAYQNKADLLATLQKLVARQRQLVTDTQAAMQANASGDAVATLVQRQEAIADQAILFLDAVKRQANAGSEDDFAVQLANVHVMLTSGKLYEKLLTAADALNQMDWATGVQAEEEGLRLLAEALKLLNTWRVERARDRITEASETLRDIAEQLGDMETRQQEIVEVTKDLTRRGTLDQDVRDELARLDEEQETWKEKLEKMAQDLYQFPELPVANDLNSKMREVYEDVEQAADSANAPAVEIAVQKEDSLLEAIRNTKERVEDVEMWLPDVPDNIKWDMETFDSAEFPDMPLVDLPQELEDIVGELLDQDAAIDMQSQDSTGNQMMADGEMGWGVADGPMPNFSAKGKSGNTRPNDNEMTGRSGAGREGQSSGELVEDTVKGLEGRETHARRTNDPLQQGQVEELDSSTLDARATGGGKLGGESESIGMFGESPRRDLQMQAPAGNQRLRQETEATYATARLLYMNNTKQLGEAADNLRRVERLDKEQKAYTSLQQRVLKQLQENHSELSSGAVLPMTVNSREQSGGTATDEVDLEDVNEAYRGIVAEYYKHLEP